jgi:hypothetical protein
MPTAAILQGRGKGLLHFVSSPGMCMGHTEYHSMYPEAEGGGTC